MMASSYNAKDEDGHITVTGPGGGTLRSKKPENTAFKQQRLPAWQPILTAGTVLPAFFIIGLIFIPIGIGLYVTSNNIKEFEVKSRYTGMSGQDDTWIHPETITLFCRVTQRLYVVLIFPVELDGQSVRSRQTPYKKVCILFQPCISANFHASCNFNLNVF